ncbi:MAG TPA: protein translocase subunit SecD [Acidimicrobiales bacterium]|nr:protein translocase subunit SecD [Acidimicrobiales bacterium]
MASVRRNRPWSLIIIVVVALLSLTYTLVTDNRPFLGLDLQGGVSVVLQPVKKDVSTDTLDEAISIINNRINSFGVSEAQVSRQGSNILVEIPGVKDKDRALALVGQTAELQFRPVLAGPFPAGTKVPASTTTSVAKGATTSTTTKGATTTTARGATTSTAVTRATTTTTTTATSTTQKALGATGTTPVHARLTAASSNMTTTTAKGATTTTAKGATTTTGPTTQITGTPQSELAKPSSKTQNVMLPENDPKTGKAIQYWYLGPVALTGSSLSTASSDLNSQGQWEIRPVFKDGKDGIDKFNAIASVCYTGNAQTCPVQQQAGLSHGQIAIVLDNAVLAAPQIDAASFQRDQITISGSFTQSEAHDIATALKYGALPVVLKPATSEIVSATLGKDALHAGLVAGVIALILVGFYMIGFYRILGALAMFKLVIEGCILWGFLCWAGPHLGLALTLAGITGIIVSIGVSLDSNVVYYEHLKEDVRAGRTIRASVDKSFASAWSTIVAADFASIIGAALLYYLTVGAVRGFAFYLGLSTILDLITSYCYMRPAVAIATRSKMCQEHPHRFGLPSPDDVAEMAAASQELVTTGARR